MGIVKDGQSNVAPQRVDFGQILAPNHLTVDMHKLADASGDEVALFKVPPGTRVYSLKLKPSVIMKRVYKWGIFDKDGAFAIEWETTANAAADTVITAGIDPFSGVITYDNPENLKVNQRTTQRPWYFGYNLTSGANETAALKVEVSVVTFLTPEIVYEAKTA